MTAPITAAPGSVVIERVIALWDECNGWIPGGARARLAEALGVDDSLVKTSQQLSRARELRLLDDGGASTALWDGDGDLWLYVAYHDRWSGPSGMEAQGFEHGIDSILHGFGISNAFGFRDPAPEVWCVEHGKGCEYGCIRS